MSRYNIIATAEESTVVSEFIPEIKKNKAYQSESELEKEFINILKNIGYEYVSIHNEEELIVNLRKQLEKLNDYKFTDNEWNIFFNKVIASDKEGIIEKTRKIQKDHIQLLDCDNGIHKNITLIEKDNINKNTLQVINQYEADKGKYPNRYDVTILVNGLPLVHIELKRRGVNIREAFNQIKRYERESFFSGSGLFNYVQLFVISNGTETKYYSNTTRESHIKDQLNSKSKSKKTSKSFEFTSFWADSKNKTIKDLVDFTKTFFSKRTLLNILTKYCVLTTEEKGVLLVMRPYQICACEKIINKIKIANNYKLQGSIDAGGYIWHTTGSGKTLTSFKTAQLALSLDYIDKVLFVVDRKDLDYQTMNEYDHFQKGAANSNTSTSILAKQLSSDKKEDRLIITTIQKLNIFVKKNKGHKIFDKNVVLIFDECHRSQFGDAHNAITTAFKKYFIFGFTGTPIFKENSMGVFSVIKDVDDIKKSVIKTTPQLFGGEKDEEGNNTRALHTYTIVDAINDNNVLKFNLSYIDTIKRKDNIVNSKVYDIDTKEALSSPIRIHNIVKYILEHFNQKTKRNELNAQMLSKLLSIKDEKLKNQKIREEREKLSSSGFNSIFAVESIPFAKQYYTEFKKQMASHPEKEIKVALIYSYAPNEEVDTLEETPEDTNGLDISSREFLDDAIKDYNNMFGTSFNALPKNFQNYYKDVSLKMKNRELDLLIVVNMFLTGFDAPKLNTLWVDKNLRYHSLLQAFSRTNRILNKSKCCGEIVCFRNLENETKDALKLFGNENSASIILLRPYKDYLNGYTDEKGRFQPGFEQILASLLEKYPPSKVIVKESEKREFIKLFNILINLINILSSFDDFKNDNNLSESDLECWRGNYLNYRDEFVKQADYNKENIVDDLLFEMELIKQVDVNIDYILFLIEEKIKEKQQSKEIKIEDIQKHFEKVISSSPALRNKDELIDKFLSTINTSYNNNSNIDNLWASFTSKEKEEDLLKIIKDENLKEEETKKYIQNSFNEGFLKTYGSDIDELLPPLSRFSSGGDIRSQKKNIVIEKLHAYFDKYTNV